MDFLLKGILTGLLFGLPVGAGGLGKLAAVLIAGLSLGAARPGGGLLCGGVFASFMFLSHRFDSSERTVGTKSYKRVTDAFYPIFPVSSTPRFGQEGGFLLFYNS